MQWDKMSRTTDRSYVDNTPVAHGGCSKLDVATWKNTTDTAGNIKCEHNTGSCDQTIYVPLQFTCCSMHGLALPMIAVQFHDTRIKLKLRDLAEVSIFKRYSPTGLLLKDDIDQGTSPPPLPISGGAIETSLMCRYVFLDDAERKHFALNKHLYLITETQYQAFAIEPNQALQTLQLYFNHPVKELIHYFVKSDYRDASKSLCVNNFWNFCMDGAGDYADDYPDVSADETLVGSKQRPESLVNMNLLLNQQKVYENGQPALYFSYLLPAQFHTRQMDGKERVYVMPFGLDPESWKPTGTLNFSRIDAVQLQLEFGRGGALKLPSGTWTTIGRNYNQLKIKSGMGGKRWAS